MKLPNGIDFFSVFFFKYSKLSRYDVSKMDLMKRDDAAVQLALGESQLVNDIKEYLTNHGQ